MKRLCCFIMAAVLAGTLTACGNDRPLSRRVTALDTVCVISLYDGKTQTTLDACVQVIEDCEARWSRTRSDSEVFAVNAANGAPVNVSAETAGLLHAARDYAALTDGAFDITTAPLTDLWKAGEASGVLPDDRALAAACALTGTDTWQLSGQTVTLCEGTQIDLGAIAKGAAADAVADELTALGCTSALINFGGNVVALGEKPDGSAFRVGIGDPRNEEAVIATVAVRNRAVVTSGSYERGYDIGGAWYSHILDPDTGKPVQNDLLSVTITAPTATQADALSTACFVMGYERAWAFVDTLSEVEAVFVLADGRVSATEGAGMV